MSNVFAANLFQGKRALVTGGGSGIGLAMARDFLLYGADAVVILGRNADKLAAAVESLKRDTGCKPDQILTLAANIRAEEEVEQACTRIAGTLGSLDILVNNAGGQFPSRTEDISAKGWHAVIETNLTGTFLMSKAFFLRFLKERGGSVVNILMNMRSGMPLMPHSAAARAGVDNLTKSWAVEWAHYGVRVNAVAPGIIASSGLDTYAPEFQAKLAETKKNNYAYRFGTEDEVSRAALFLASPAASYITGVTLAVDGGESIFNPFLPPRPHEKLPPLA